MLVDSSNILSLLSDYDLVVDATDNVATRYLLNDACVLTGKILVSGSALKMDGQLTVYNYRKEDGPCYRCLFPSPPPPNSVMNCSDGGVLGAVTGVIGCLQALEVIKIVSGLGPSFAKKLLLFDATLGAIRTVKIRSRLSNCAVCGDNPSITKLIDYVQFCGAAPTDKAISLSVLSPEERIDCQELSEYRLKQKEHILIDCREKTQFEICSLSNSYSKSERRCIDCKKTQSPLLLFFK
jgi:adenylyltransferase/sulfurtransferase